MTPKLLALYVLALALACAQPAPKPTNLDAGVVDIFSAQIFNCRLPVVSVERDSAMGDVRACLLKSTAIDVNACTVKQAGQYNSATVACLVRDVGARANAAYLAGSIDLSEKTVADSARQWIASHYVGYVSLEVSP